MQINGAAQLAAAYRQAGREEASAERMDKELLKRSDELREFASAELVKAESRASAAQRKVAEAKGRVHTFWKAAMEGGFDPGWGQTADPGRWLDDLERRCQEVAALEHAEQEVS